MQLKLSRMLSRMLIELSKIVVELNVNRIHLIRINFNSAMIVECSRVQLEWCIVIVYAIGIPLHSTGILTGILLDSTGILLNSTGILLDSTGVPLIVTFNNV